ncbi:MAG: hypothetical protein JXA54_03765 [Candidatus Heimdallarchaeota archaeon]|nr:hypothetical protein [Candidatus Heimdallarchaeota archaeon]
MKTEFNRITVKVQAWFTKTLNGSSGTSSFLMRGGEIPYRFQGKVNVRVSELEEFIDENKTYILDDLKTLREKAKAKKSDAKLQVSIYKEVGVTRVVKGIRGAIRHQIMDILHQKGIDYCSPTLKEIFQSSNEPTLLTGEHIMGACGTVPCPLRQLFGMLGEEAPIRVWSDVIVQIDRPADKITQEKGRSYVYVSTENRHAARRDKKPLIDFSEQYFSGEFRFYVEFTKELPDWLLGLLFEGILGITQLGGGNNAGYGRVEFKEIAFEHITSERKLGPEKEGKITIIDKDVAVNQNNKIEEYLAAWNKHK